MIAPTNHPFASKRRPHSLSVYQLYLYHLLCDKLRTKNSVIQANRHVQEMDHLAWHHDRAKPAKNELPYMELVTDSWKYYIEQFVTLRSLRVMGCSDLRPVAI